MALTKMVQYMTFIQKIKIMAKNLIKSTRIHVYGGDNNEMMAFAMIGFDYSLQNQNNDSVVNLVRGTKEQMSSLLKQYGNFTNDDLNHILNMKYKETWWCSEYDLIVRIA